MSNALKELMLVRDTKVALTKAEKYHWDNYVMVKRWGKWPADWRGCGWRHEHIVGINYLEDLFVKAQKRDREMAEQEAQANNSSTITAAGGGKTTRIIKPPTDKGPRPRIDF